MSDLFYKAIRAQDHLDVLYPDRYWPVGAESAPVPHVIAITKMYAGGMRPCDIIRKLGVSKAMVTSITRRSRFNQMSKHSCRI